MKRSKRVKPVWKWVKKKKTECETTGQDERHWLDSLVIRNWKWKRNSISWFPALWVLFEHVSCCWSEKVPRKVGSFVARRMSFSPALCFDNFRAYWHVLFVILVSPRSGPLIHCFLSPPPFHFHSLLFFVLSRKKNESGDNMHQERVRYSLWESALQFVRECAVKGSGAMRLLRYTKKARQKKAEIHWSR